jgi:transposase
VYLENWTWGQGGKAYLGDIQTRGTSQGGFREGMRSRYDAQFKARVALVAIRGDRTLAEIASAYQVHPNQITKWKRQVLEELLKVFPASKERGEAQHNELLAQLYQQIGQLTVELDWLKKCWTYRLISYAS